MKATLTNSDSTTKYTFHLEHDGRIYDVCVYLNAKGKFIDESISFEGKELEFEGTEGQIREDILTCLDDNWDELVKE